MVVITEIAKISKCTNAKLYDFILYEYLIVRKISSMILCEYLIVRKIKRISKSLSSDAKFQALLPASTA